MHNNGLFYNKYRIDSSRLPGFDYSQNGLYFVTICTYEQEIFFGDVKNGEMFLNDVGKLAKKYWQEIPQHFDNLRLDEFVIMPNHVHGIVVIDRVNNADGGKFTENDFAPSVETPNLGVSTPNPTNPTNPAGGHKPEWKSGTLGVIINQYKRKCTIEIRKSCPDFAWQTRFYDHIIRNEKSLNNIRTYIKNNPEKWDRDRNSINFQF